MNAIATPIADLMIIEPRVFEDERGHFFEAYSEQKLASLGITDRFVQMNQSFSRKGVLRGLHFQTPPHAQSKLVRCLRGALFDVAVDLRRSSSTYGQWFGVELTEENKRMLYVPRGFAHGFVALTDAEMLYLCGEAGYHQSSEGGIHPHDPEVGIVWPYEGAFSINDRDSAFPRFKDFETPFA